MFNGRCYVCGRAIQGRAVQWKNAFVPQRTQSHAVRCSTRGQMWPVNASALTGRPSTRSPARPGANTLPQKWSLGQSKCQLCAVKPMSQCWRGTQGPREASNQTTPSIWITSSAGLQQFFQVLFKCLSLLCESSATNSRSSGLLTVNQAEGFQLAFTSWTQRQTALDCWHRDCASVLAAREWQDK